MKNTSNFKMQFMVAFCLMLSTTFYNSINAQTNFCEAIQIDDPSIEYCQEIILNQKPSNISYKKSCDPVNGIENSRWFCFEIANPTDLLIITVTDSPWSLYSYTGTPCPAEIDALIEIECSLNGNFNDVFTTGKYYIQIDGNEGESTTCAQLNYLAVFGCTDTLACNYNANATVDNDSCEFVGCTASIGGYIWFDENGDGLQNTNENPIANISVTLTDVNGSIIDAQVTNSAGFYEFTELEPGTYTVTVGAGPPGAILTTAGSYTITVSEDQNNNAGFGFDFEESGCQSFVEIMNPTCGDCNGEILINTAEELKDGVNHWFFEFWQGTTANGDPDKINADLFLPNGFDQLCPGDYFIRVTGIAGDIEGCMEEFQVTISSGDFFDPNVVTTMSDDCETVPTGSITINAGDPGNYTYTIEPGGQELEGGNVIEIGNLGFGDYFITVESESGCTAEVQATVEAPIDCICTCSTVLLSTTEAIPVTFNLNDYVTDLDGNVDCSTAVFDPIIGGILTQIGCDVTITPDPGYLGVITFSYTIGSNCNCVGQVTIVGEILGCTDQTACNYLPEAMIDDGSCDFGNPNCPEPCNVILGCTDPQATNHNPAANCDNESCIYPTSSIGDYVWYDANINGIQDAGEIPIRSGVLIILTGSTIGTQTQVTNSSGFYNFTGLMPDTYTVTVGAGPTGATLTTPNSYTVNLGPNQNFANADFGFKPFFVVNVTASQPTVCLGDSTKVEAFPLGGIPPYAYLWNTGDTTKCITVKPDTNTVYSVTVTDSIGCTTTGSQKVYVSPFGFISQPTNELIVRIPEGEPIDSAVAKITEGLLLNYDGIRIIIKDTCDCDGLILLEFPDIEEGTPKTMIDMECLKKDSSESLGPEGDVSINQKICYWEPLFNDNDNCSYKNADDAINNPIVVGIIDTGIDKPFNNDDGFLYTHQEMGCVNDIGDTYVVENGTVFGIDRFDYHDQKLQDSIGHGTFISNIIANDSLNNLNIFVSKFIDQNCSKNSSLFNAICSIEKMEEYNNSVNDSQKVKVLNLSMGYYGPVDTILYDAIKAIGETGTTVVCSAGNSSINLDVDEGLLRDTTQMVFIDTILADSITENLDTIQIEVYDTTTQIQVDFILLNHYPSEFDLPNIISVTSWDFEKDSLAHFSNYGPNSVDIVAPGIKIKSKIPEFLEESENGDGYDIQSGTSFAAPFITRWIARILSEYPSLNTTQIIDTIIYQSDYMSSLNNLVKIEKLLPFELTLENCDLDDIDGFVWLDENANGIFDNNETGIDNVLITSTSLEDESIRTTQTDSNGYYEFPNLLEGTYTIKVDTIENLNLTTEDEYEISIPLSNDESYNFGFVQEDTLCDNTAILNEFPWLNNIIDFNNCAGISINFYNFGDFQFFEIVGIGNNKLYFQDGSLYCEDSEGFSCAEVYCLHVTATTWECCGTNNNEESDPEVCEAISNYPWIADIIDIENCDSGSIKVYNFPGYAFILISEGENPNKLYLNDGRLWCTDGLGLDCESAYGLTDAQISEECNCGDVINDNLDGIFEQYPWVLTFINPEDCTNEQISEYEYLNDNYLYIETDECKALYANDGSLFCIDSENFSCLDFYNLTNPINNWSCISDRLEINQVASNIDFRIIPNPNNGNFEILIPVFKEGIYLINIYDINGALIKTIVSKDSDDSKQIAIDLQDVATGIYYVEVVNNFEKVTKKMIRY